MIQVIKLPSFLWILMTSFSSSAADIDPDKQRMKEFYLPQAQAIDFGLVLLPEPQQFQELKQLSETLTFSLSELPVGKKPENFNEKLWEYHCGTGPRPAINPHISLAWGACLKDEISSTLHPLLTKVAATFSPLSIKMSSHLIIDDEADVTFDSQSLEEVQINKLKWIYSAIMEKYNNTLQTPLESTRARWEHFHLGQPALKEWRSGGFLHTDQLEDTFDSLHLTLSYGAATTNLERQKRVKEWQISKDLLTLSITHVGIIPFGFDRNAIGGKESFIIPLTGTN